MAIVAKGHPALQLAAVDDPVRTVRLELLTLPEATTILRRHMFGGLRLPTPVADARRRGIKLRQQFKPQLDEAGRRLAQAVIAEDLALYCVSARLFDDQASGARRLFGLLRITPGVAKRLIKDDQLRDLPRLLPDDLSQPGISSARLFAALERGRLVVLHDQFRRWIQGERERRRWPSQATAVRPNTRGRPSIIHAVRQPVTALVAQGEWKPRDGLERLADLVARGEGRRPSGDTVGRVLDQLYAETGDPGYLRKTNRKGSSKVAKIRRQRPSQNT